jgi:RNA polymerase sigma-70 factor (ECF subfamily)
MDYAQRGNHHPSPIEAYLIDRIREGDRTALEVIYRAYRPQLVTFAERCGGLSTQSAAEIVQEVFLDVWRHRRDLNPSPTIAVHLFGAVGHRLQRPSRLGALGCFPLTDPPIEPDAKSPTIVGDLTATITGIVDSMRPRCREVYDLRHTCGLDLATTAQVLGLTTATVRRRHARALHLLAQGLASTSSGRQDASGRSPEH